MLKKLARLFGIKQAERPLSLQERLEVAKVTVANQLDVFKQASNKLAEANIELTNVVSEIDGEIDGEIDAHQAKINALSNLKGKTLDEIEMNNTVKLRLDAFHPHTN